MIAIFDQLVPHRGYDEMAGWFEDRDNVSRIGTKPMSKAKHILYMASCALLYALYVVFFCSYFVIVIPSVIYHQMS